MKYLLFVCLFSVSAFALEEPCDCPKLGCDPCSLEKGMTFYTSKCGPQQSRLKSCARPTCEVIPVATKECPVLPAKDAGPREPIVVAAAPSEKADPNADTRIVGAVKVLSGSVSIVHADGRKTTVNGEAKVRELDAVESGGDGTAIVNFDGGNKLHVHPSTAVQVKEYRDSGDADSRKALLQLIKGKIRNQVEQKYNGKTSYYKVFTTGAVAGVRGTDFVIEHSEIAGLAGKAGGMETRVEGLNGRVILASLDEHETRAILRGEGATFSAELPDASFKGKDFSEFIKRGKLSPVYKIPADRLKDLDSDSRVDVAKVNRRKGTKEVEICDKPKGQFNQCAWTCVGNPGGEKTCRADLPEVSCIRTHCNANGKWGDETKLNAADARGVCPAAGFVVKACDY